MIDEDFRARYIIIRASFVSNFRFTQILLHKVLARLGIMCPEIEHWNDKKWSTIHQLRLRLSITIDFNSSPRVHINYQLKGHNHEDECNITQKKTLHTLIFHRGTTSWNNVSSCRYSCRYLVYFPKHCQLLPPVQTACLVTSVDCGPSWAAWVGGVELPCITEHRTPSRIGDITKPWTLCLDWGRWKDDTKCGYTALSMSSPDSVTFISWVCFLHFVRTRQNM